MTASVVVNAQGSRPKNRASSLNNYEIIFSDYMNVDYTDRDGKVERLAFIYVPPRKLSRKRLDEISLRLRAKYSADDSMMLIFGVDRHLITKLIEPSDSDAEDNRKMKAIRGIYYFDRNSNRKELRYYPNGVTERDLEN